MGMESFRLIYLTVKNFQNCWSALILMEMQREKYIQHTTGQFYRTCFLQP